MQPIRPKRLFGQHFLHDQNIARKIVSSLKVDNGPEPLLEVGPGTGALTRLLLEKGTFDLTVVEVDRDAVAYLRECFPGLEDRVVEADILKSDFNLFFPGSYSVVGNFPYNISSQILFRVLEGRKKVRQVVCMLQREVAERLSSPPGNKTYGILSVLLQAYYSVRLLFRVPSTVFVPRPRVESAVIRLERYREQLPSCDEQLFTRVVKQAFNNRRKTLRNALKDINLPPEILGEQVFSRRAEELSVDDFLGLTSLIQHRGASDHSV